MPTIKPDEKIKLFWDILILFIILGFFIIIPLQLSFDFFYDEVFEKYAETLEMSHSLTTFIVFLPDLILLLDSALKMITGYYENGLIVMNKHQIFHHYISKTMIYDLLSYLPLVLQVALKEVFIETNTQIILKVLQFFMYAKAKRIHTIINTFEEIISLKGKRDHVISILRLCFWIFFICHINACFWHGIAYYQKDDVVTWLVASNYKECWSPAKYLHSLYWAVSVMVTMGYSDKISPQNDLETLFAIIILMVSAILYGYSMNMIREIFDEISKNYREHKFYSFISLYLF